MLGLSLVHPPCESSANQQPGIIQLRKLPLTTPHLHWSISIHYFVKVYQKPRLESEILEEAQGHLVTRENVLSNSFIECLETDVDKLL